MPAKISTHVFKGMLKDINVVNSSNEYLFDAHNIRFNLLDDNTLMSIVNERGNEYIINIGNVSVEQYVSHYVIDNHIVVFTYYTTTPIGEDTTYHINSIYRIDINEPNSPTKTTLYTNGDLNIRPEHPLEFTSYYEAEGVIKLYWVDGVNQLRFMNIMETYTNPNDFNTTPELKLEEEVTVEQIEGNGLFPAGVIQYALTYVNKLGAESNIFYTSELHSILFANRAAGPLEFINCAFRITVENIDTSFDYIRCYQLLRTSLDAQPTCLVLNEVPISGVDPLEPTIIIIDTNDGATYDPTALLFQKYPIKANTLDLKSNTLFLGNFEESMMDIPETTLAQIKDYFAADNVLTFTHDDSSVSTGAIKYLRGDTFSYKYNPNADVIRTFKSGEVYRIAIQLQDKYGVWTLPIYIKDLEVECTLFHDGDYAYPIYFNYTKPAGNLPAFLGNYKRFRFLMVNPTSGDRTKLVQGLVTPTMYELSDRIFNTPYAYSSWFARPFNSNVVTKLNGLVPAGKDYEAELLARYLALDADFTLIHDWYTDAQTYQSPYATAEYSDTPGPAILSFELDILIHGGTPNIYINLINCGITKRSLRLKYTPICNRVLEHQPFAASTYSVLDGNVYKLNDDSRAITNDILAILKDENTDDIYKLFADGSTNEADLSNKLHTWLNSIYLEDFDINHWGPSDKVTFTAFTSIQSLSMTFDSLYYDVPEGTVSVFNFNSGGLSDFRIDHSILNLYSPDIDNQYYDIHNNDSVNLNLVGYTKVLSLLDSVYIQLETSGSSPSCVISPYFNFSKLLAGKEFEFARGVFKDSIVYKRLRDESETIMRNTGMLTTAYPDYDSPWPDDEMLRNSTAPIYSFAIYPWHGAGSLNNEDNTEGDNRSARYTKIFAKLWNCDDTEYYELPYEYRAYGIGEDSSTHNVSGCKCSPCFVSNNTNNVIMFKQDGTSRTYIGNPDLARTFVKMYNGISNASSPVELGYDIYIIDNDTFKPLDSFSTYAYTHNTDGELEKKFLFDYTKITPGDYSNRYPQRDNTKTIWKPIIYKVDPILIKYNADTHVVIPINRRANHTLSILPTLIDNDNNAIEKADYFPLWDNWVQYHDVVNRIYDSSNNPVACNDYSYYHIGELVRTGEIVRYNGPIEFDDNEYNKDNPVLLSNIFIPIMESKPIDDLLGTVKTKYGDTWYGRWDCLKTLHKTDLDEQSVHDYVSIMIESHINLNGRYDSYRNFYDLTLVNALNANKFNDVYSQMDTFWSYKVTPNYLNTTNYPNQVTWSLTKQTGALVDEWTRVTAANVLELDGNKGPINKILNYRDSLFVFQDRCISLIKYNEQTLMTTTEGVPVEISNSQKVTGIVKIYDGTGCINKWSIASDANGIFFVDNINECIMWLGGSLDTPIVNLTNSKAFTLFMKANNSFDVWNPEDFSNFVTFIDSAHKDVYFVNADKCLCFSLVLLEFTSFYDYQRTFGMFNINNNFYSLYSPYTVNQLTNVGSYGLLKLYRNFTGRYNYIYDGLKSTLFTFIDHGESFLTDKTFTNINYIQDAYCVQQYNPTSLLWNPVTDSYINDYDEVNYKYEKNITFDKLRVWTPFLNTGDMTLNSITSDGSVSNVQRKFRTWGILIPRDSVLNPSGDLTNTVDRIRNNWAKFKFTFTLPDYNEDGTVKQGVTNPRDIKIELMNINILSIE